MKLTITKQRNSELNDYMLLGVTIKWNRNIQFGAEYYLS